MGKNAVKEAGAVYPDFDEAPREKAFEY